MKIVHLYAKNIEAFSEAVKDTECRLHASTDINYLLKSIQNYNVRDVMGLVIFANPMTKKCIKLIRKFDSLFIYQQLPVIVVCDRATELYQAGYFKLKHAKLYLIDSEENSISDVEISAIFTTLLASTGEIYDLSGCPAEKVEKVDAQVNFEKEITMSDSLTELFGILEGSEKH